MRLIDVLMSFPALLLALGLIVILGRGVTNAILAIGVVYLTTTSRITYGLTLRLRTETYVEAAHSMGAGTGVDDPQAHPAQSRFRRCWCRRASSSPLRNSARRRSTFSASARRPKSRAGATCWRSRASSSPARRGCCSFPAWRSLSPRSRSTSSAMPCATASIRVSVRCLSRQQEVSDVARSSDLSVLGRNASRFPRHRVGGVVRYRQGRDPRPGRRIRLRQEHDVAGRHGPAGRGRAAGCAAGGRTRRLRRHRRPALSARRRPATAALP